MSVAAKQVLTRHGVVIAVDPHKASWTAVVVTADLAAADSIRVEVNRAGYPAAAPPSPGPTPVAAIEGAAGLGAPLTERLREEQIAVTDVPAKLARRVRLLSTGHGRKSDKADALSIGIAMAMKTSSVSRATSASRSADSYARANLATIASSAGEPAAAAAWPPPGCCGAAHWPAPA